MKKECCSCKGVKVVQKALEILKTLKGPHKGPRPRGGLKGSKEKGKGMRTFTPKFETDSTQVLKELSRGLTMDEIFERMEKRGKAKA